MIERENERKNGGRAGPGGTFPGPEELPYSIELWNSAGEVERTLGRALSVHLARSIFTAAQTEFPARRITLRRDADIISSTA